MEKVIVVLLVIFLLGSICVEATFLGHDNLIVEESVLMPFASGRGMPKDPYLIKDVHQLQNMRLHPNSYYALANNIDASETREWNGGMGFFPIGEDYSAYTYGNPFTGSFTGNGYTITGLFINRSDMSCVGLFGCVGNSGVVSNIGLLDVYVNGRANVGGLVGVNRGGTVRDSYANGNVVGSVEAIGGLVGYNEGIISESYSTVDVAGAANYLGGLVGWNYDTIYGSYAKGNVSGNIGVGGLVGINSQSLVSLSYAICNVSGYSLIGGLVGYNDRGEVSNSYAMGNINGDDNVGGLIGKNWYGTAINSHYNIDRVLINEANHVSIGGLYDKMYQDWFSNDLTLDIANYRDTLIPTENYYEIRDIQGFKDILGFAGNIDYNFSLGANIDLNGVTGLYIPYLATEFNGNNHTISNLYLDIPFVSNLGTFGYLDIGGKVTNIRILDAYINGSVHVHIGGLVGLNSGVVSDSYVSGKVIGDRVVGGLIGQNEGMVSNSYATGNVNGTDWYVGGLVGLNWYGTVSNSYAYGNVNGDRYVGGLVGSNSDNGMVSNSYATVNVSGNDRIGGLVGNNGGTVENSYATVNVSGNDRTGGLVGNNDANAMVSNSYATGNVSGSSRVGGLVGHNGGTVSNCYSMSDVIRVSGSIQTDIGGFAGQHLGGKIINCYSIGGVRYENAADPTNKGFIGTVNTGGSYEMTGNFWDVETSGQNNTAGNATGKSTAEMKDVYTFKMLNWIMDVIPNEYTRDRRYRWNIVNGITYPLLNLGTLEPFEISDWHDLNIIRYDLTGNYILVYDLDQETGGYMDYNDPATFGWQPIGDWDNRFTGTFDGQGHEIVGLSINRHSRNVGLFGFICTGSEVKNIGLINANIIGSDVVGGLVGGNYGTVDNSYVAGTVIGGRNIGGLVGMNACTVSNSYATGTVIGTWDWTYVGGLVGLNEGTVDNSYANGYISGKGYVGGLVGLMNKGCIIDSLFIGDVHGLNYVGGLMGSGRGTLGNSYFIGNVTGQIFVGGLVGHLLSGGIITNSHYNIDGVTINNEHLLTAGGLYERDYQAWVSNDLHLDISHYSDTIVPSDNQYEISCTDGLKALLGFAWNPEYSFCLGNDIDMFDIPGLYIPYIASDFDGDQYMILNMRLDMPFASNLGLFGYVQGGKVSNLIVADAYVRGFSCIGGVIGVNNGGEIVNIRGTSEVMATSNLGGLVGYNDGSVRDSYMLGHVFGGYYAGGLVGYNTGKIVNSHCKSFGSVTGASQVGGLVGFNYFHATIENSSASVEVDGNNNVGGLLGYNEYGIVKNSFAAGNVRGRYYVGGLVGVNDYRMDSPGFYPLVEKSYALGDVSGYDSVGGLIGWNYISGIVINSYSKGSVTRLMGSTGMAIGGFIGRNQGRIIKCYSTGGVRYQGTDDPIDKGFVGYVDIGWSYEMTGNLWDVEQSGQISTEGNATGKTTDEMMNLTTFTNSGWDIINVDDPYTRNTGHVWNIAEKGSYPFLNWQYIIYPLYSLEILERGEGTTIPEIGNTTFTYGEEVIVIAIPSYGWRFTHWSGDVPVGEEYNDEITIFMDGDKIVTAHFERQQFSLNISVEGDGTTVPSLVDHTHLYEDEVNVTAIPAEGWRFSHWSGNVSEGEEYNETIRIFINSNKTLVAHFEELLFIPDNIELVVTPVEGETPLNVTITVRGYNIGLLNGSVDVLINDAIVHTLFLPATESAEHTFTHTFQELGTYTIAFHNLTEIVVVTDTENGDVEPSGTDAPLWILPVMGIIMVLLALMYYIYKSTRKHVQAYGDEDMDMEGDEEVGQEMDIVDESEEGESSADE